MHLLNSKVSLLVTFGVQASMDEFDFLKHKGEGVGEEYRKLGI